MTTQAELPQIGQTLDAVARVPRAWIVRSLAGGSTPRSADELAEVLNLPTSVTQEHIDVLVAIGALTQTQPAQTARARYLVDADRVRQLAAQIGAYLTGA